MNYIIDSKEESAVLSFLFSLHVLFHSYFVLADYGEMESACATMRPRRLRLCVCLLDTCNKMFVACSPC